MQLFVSLNDYNIIIKKIHELNLNYFKILKDQNNIILNDIISINNYIIIIISFNKHV